ncbi:murein hydrolase activator EnvC family protein [Usitatibacter palustris]|uniref:Murein hydrolase activator EnvC n=1 Tax=Usitatibacter palustris TaxID=2732487 RepID=A0A6M4H2V1_9PROT|nr:peptidoglycan DD-metalloendopeptidase family protein [Usitatibacter palustris]QJR13901.1 Murein hydrolase activator EnvC [Usitatibacter palustris]
MARARLAAAFALLLAFAVPTTGQGRANEADLRELRGRIEKLQKELADAEGARGGALDELRASEKAVSEAKRALFELAGAERGIQSDLEKLAARSRDARAAIATQEAAAERLLRLQYFQGAPDRLRLLLEGRDAAEVARQLQYYGYIQRARAELIVQLRQGAAEVESLEREARTRREALTENQAAQEREAKRLDRERAERAVVVQRLAGDIERSKREIGKLKRDEARLAKLVEEIARRLAKPPADATKPKGRAIDEVADASLALKPFATLKGRLKLPVRGELTGRYGSPREEGGATWKGLFIKASAGETVRAVADGQVVYADWLRGFGNLLILDHGKAYMSLYAYNEGLLRQVGDRVRSGDAIAQVGDSGGAGESGLYFELRQDGKPFDPMRWVAP